MKSRSIMDIARDVRRGAKYKDALRDLTAAAATLTDTVTF